MYTEVMLPSGVWVVTVRDRQERIVRREVCHNIITDLGRESILKQWAGIAGGLNFIYLGVGDGTTAAAATQTALVNELTGNADRIYVTDKSGGSLDSGDIETDTGTPPYRRKIILRGVYGLSDGNNGQDMQEFGLFSSDTFASGTMGNRFVLGSPIPKTSSISVTIETTIRV